LTAKSERKPSQNTSKRDKNNRQKIREQNFVALKTNFVPGFGVAPSAKFALFPNLLLLENLTRRNSKKILNPLFAEKAGIFFVYFHKFCLLTVHYISYLSFFITISC
jgi:hypothetical protein